MYEALRVGAVLFGWNKPCPNLLLTIGQNGRSDEYENDSTMRIRRGGGGELTVA